jgi:glucose-6-phosphate-specific signal transduction histidine kinase
VSIQDFSVAAAGRTLQPHYYAIFNQTYSRVTCQLEISRLSAAYTRRLVVGIVILFSIALFLFLLKPSEINRLIGTLTVFLAIVAYSFVLGQQTPQVRATGPG